MPALPDLPELPGRIRLCPALLGTAVLLVAVLFPDPSRAAPQALADTELAAVRGADGSILAGFAGTGTTNPLGNGLATAFSSSTGPTELDAAAFAQALQAAGWPAGAAMPGYDGQAVQQLRVDAAPVSFSFDANQLLQATTGLAFAGSSMGRFTLTNLDARGTIIWSWPHP